MISEQDFDDMAVVGHIADIVHAFKEGTTYLRRIKERRKTRRPPPGLMVDMKSIQDLEFSLTRGQDVVRSHYERDYRRLGQPYATGDREAASKLKSILSELQRIVVMNLKKAYQHDQHIDFLMLQDISDESQDRAIMCLMQLHQRVLTSVDLEDIANGNPYGSNTKRPESRSRNPPRIIPEESEISPTSRQQNARMAPPEGHSPTYQRATGPLTPGLSPSYDQGSYLGPEVAEYHISRQVKPSDLPLAERQPAVPPLPTPPADKALGAPPGPPPTGPLPPAPLEWHRQRRKEELAHIRGEAERRAQTQRQPDEVCRPVMDRAFAQAENTWQHPWDREQDARVSEQFEEPHPGIQVDPSRIDEPRLQHGSLSPRTINRSVDLADFPRPGASPRPIPGSGSHPISLQHRANVHDPLIYSPPREIQGPWVNGTQRLSGNSTTTYSSHTSGSVNSAMSRATSISSSQAGWSGTSPPVPNMPAVALAARSRPLARVPEPIYESSGYPGSQSTLRLAESRQSSAPEVVPSPLSASSMGMFPRAPPIPQEIPPAIDPRRASAFSNRSASSAGSTPATAVPIRTIPSDITNASNSKMYMPTEANKFGGLCKGSWRAQIGDFKKAYQAQQRPGGVASNRMIDFMKCKSCEFSGRVVLNGKGKKGPDRKIIVSKDTGLAYRWDFLFKCHLALKNGSSADAEYGCMFCCAEGKGTPVFKSMTSFVAHVAEHRPGIAGFTNDLHEPDTLVCDRMEAIVGRTMETDERYEIALPIAENRAAFPAPDGSLSPTSTMHPALADPRAVSRGSSRY